MVEKQNLCSSYITEYLRHNLTVSSPIFVPESKDTIIMFLLLYLCHTNFLFLFLYLKDCLKTQSSCFSSYFSKKMFKTQSSLFSFYICARIFKTHFFGFSSDITENLRQTLPASPTIFVTECLLHNLPVSPPIFVSVLLTCSAGHGLVVAHGGDDVCPVRVTTVLLEKEGDNQQN